MKSHGRPSAAPPETPTRSNAARAWLVAAAVAALALGLRLAGIGWGLPGVYEEASPFRVAWGMWSWDVGGHATLHPHFFKYPSLAIYLQLAGQKLLYGALAWRGRIHSAVDFQLRHVLDPTPFFLVGRSITALFGAAMVVPVYFAARRVAPGAGFVAALLVALNVALIGKSQVIEVDVPLTFFVAAACGASLWLLERPSPRAALVTGLAIGLAASTKYTGAFLLVPAAVALALGPASTAKDAAAASRPAALGLLVAGAAVAFFVTSPFVALDFAAFRHDLAMEREHMRVGHFGVEQGRAWGPYLRMWLSDIAGWPLGLASLAALVHFAAIRRERWALVLASFVLVYFGVVGSWSMKADRYLLPLVPPAAVLAAVGAARVARWVAARGQHAWLEPATLALALIAFAAPSLARYPELAARQGVDPRARARAWVLAHLPAGSLIAIETYGPELPSAMEVQAMRPELAAAFMARRAPVYAVQQIPLFQVGPERSADYYDLALYEAADAVVVTGSVRSRYAREPQRFARQLAFYDSLEHRFVRAQEFLPAAGAGSSITIYRNPRWSRPFASRADTPPPVPLRSATAPGVAYWYLSLGMSHEMFGFVDRAIDCYRMALRVPSTPANLSMAAAGRLGYGLLARGTPEEAKAYLADAEAHAARPDEAAMLRALAEDVTTRAGEIRRRGLPDLRTSAAQR